MLRKFDELLVYGTRIRGSVVFRLAVSIFLFSSMVTLLLTAGQLYLDYSRGVRVIESRLVDIDKSYRETLGEGLWRVDEQQLRLQLEGILRLSDIRAVEVREAVYSDTPLMVTVGQRATGSAVAREFPIIYKVDGVNRKIGILYVEATLANLYRQLMNTVLFILIGQAAKTFLVSLFIIYIFSRLVTRHLATIADFVGSYQLDRPQRPLRLQRNAPKREDELERVVAAFNAMYARLQDAYERLRKANTDMQQEIFERRRAEAALRTSETRIRRLIESNIIGVFFWDIAGNVTDANDAFLAIVGYSRPDLASRKINWADFTPPEYNAADQQAMDELMKRGTCSPYEKELVRKDGERVPVLVGGAFLEGSQENGVAYFLDMSERKRAESERDLRMAAESANRAKSIFLANMSHELRTPLNGILGYAQILHREKGLSERQLAGLNVIQQSGEHLLTLINDILDFAKIEAGKQELYPIDIALPEFLLAITEIVGIKAAQKNLDFLRDLAADLPRYVRGDEKRLRQVLLNLLSNAIKFTDSGQVWLRVRFSPPTRLHFEVQDTGIGISEEHLKNLFQPFEQVGDTQRRFGGSGLGLAISRQFVRLMGGDIEVKSRVNEGSTFRFELDLPVVDAGPVASVQEGFVRGYEGPRKKILVVDDVAENRAVVIDMLRQLGFDMLEAENGRTGLAMARAAMPDLILMDIVMPEMGGLQAVRLLRQEPALANVPVITISASASPDDQEASRASGANAFLPKPIDFNRLLPHMTRLLKLVWIYETPAVQQEEARQAAPMVVPPEEEMEVLYRLARFGNMQNVLRQASHLIELDERYRPFSEKLSELAKGYQSKAILKLVEQYFERKEVSQGRD